MNTILTHSAYGVTLPVVLDNEKVLTGRVIFTEIPDSIAHTGDGCIYVNDQFMKLSDDTRNTFLVHESAHFALGHKFPVEDIEERDRLETEAAKWTVKRVGIEAYASAMTEAFMVSLPQYSVYMDVPEFTREEAISEFIEHFKTHVLGEGTNHA